MLPYDDSHWEKYISTWYILIVTKQGLWGIYMFTEFTKLLFFMCLLVDIREGVDLWLTTLPIHSLKNR